MWPRWLTWLLSSSLCQQCYHQITSSNDEAAAVRSGWLDGGWASPTQLQLQLCLCYIIYCIINEITYFITLQISMLWTIMFWSKELLLKLMVLFPCHNIYQSAYKHQLRFSSQMSYYAENKYYSQYGILFHISYSSLHTLW